MTTTRVRGTAIKACLEVPHVCLESPSTAVIGLTAGVPDDTEKVMLNVGAVAVLDKAGFLQILHQTIVEAVKGRNFCLGLFL